MTTPMTRRRYRRRRAAAPTHPGPATRVRAARQTGPAQSGADGCCRTWSSEHVTQGGLVVRTTWHEPACPTWARR